VFSAFKEAFWALGLPVIILAGIYLGVMTPTEAAAVSVAYVIVIELFIYRSVTVKDIFKIAVTSGRMVAMIFILIGAGSLLSWVITVMQIPQAIVTTMGGSSRIAILLLINAIFLVAGMFLDPNSMVIVLTPLVLPLAKVVGIDLLHLGIIIVLDAAIGMLTPPFGLNIFVSIGTFKRPYAEVVPTLVPYIILMIAVLVLVSAVPDVALWLPNQMK
jgi:C4-dicarboxylate transporter DctM subunit